MDEEDSLPKVFFFNKNNCNERCASLGQIVIHNQLHLCVYNQATLNN